MSTINELNNNVMLSTATPVQPVDILVKKTDGAHEPFDQEKLYKTVLWAIQGHEQHVTAKLIIKETQKLLFSGMNSNDIINALIMATTSFIERDFSYGYVAARLLLRKQYDEVINESIESINATSLYRQSFINGIHRGITENILTPEMASFDLTYLANQLDTTRDSYFDFMGLRTLYERYFLRTNEKDIIELPQSFWMRIAMGLALQEGETKNECAVHFYNVISSMQYVPSTPTLLHAGMNRPQLSSCFLATVEDDLHHIFKCFGDQAQLSKWSGGVAYDWSNIRAIGANIKSIKTESQGVIPFLKIANDTTAAINRSGKRRGASVVYLETWHYEIEDFIDLRKNTGDERRRTHDINTAHWVPDLFMKRVRNNEIWTLFSPHEVPDLHHVYGQEFEKRYCAYEQKALAGEMEMFRQLPAKELYRKMLSSLFATGHPWITFKDACNIRSPQDHIGVVHSSNLCTEITLNTSADETAVCNLGSINLGRHIKDGELDYQLLKKTITSAVRMLDNVIDINYYPVKEAQNANMRHRPVGLGVMGFQDALYQLNIHFESEQARQFADESMEYIANCAIMASSLLAKERGTYLTYPGSKWSRNILPQDSIDLLERERGITIPISRNSKLDWTPVRDHIKQYGMRNSNVMAIAPTATISTISDCFPCIEPIYKNIYVKANMSGEFTVVNKYLVQDLKDAGLWDQNMLDLLKYYDGSVQRIEQIPQTLKNKYKEAFEIDPQWLVSITVARGKWIDQSQSHNVFMRGASGKQLYDVYMNGWEMGIKTFYYLRTLGASQIEKSTLDANKFGFTQKRTYTQQEDSSVMPAKKINDTTMNIAVEKKACNIYASEECESCQ